MKLEQTYRYMDNSPEQKRLALDLSKKILAQAVFDVLEISTKENRKIFTIELFEFHDMPMWDSPYPMMCQYRISANVEMAEQNKIWITKLDYDYKNSSMPEWLKWILGRLYPDG